MRGSASNFGGMGLETQSVHWTMSMPFELPDTAVRGPMWIPDVNIFGQNMRFKR